MHNMHNHLRRNILYPSLTSLVYQATHTHTHFIRCSLYFKYSYWKAFIIKGYVKIHYVNSIWSYSHHQPHLKCDTSIKL